jgi:hypothetical protein
MNTTRTRSLRPVLLLGALLLVAAPALQAADEGIDPMRQITEQMDAANFLIVQDVTGSMRWDDAGNSLSYAENSTGNLFWNQGCYYEQNKWDDNKWYGCRDETGRPGRSVRGRTIGIGDRTVPTDKGEDCSGSNCRVWNYILTFEEPSRLAIIKNALGDTVSIVESYVPPPFFNGGVAAGTGAASWNQGNQPGSPFRGDWGTLPAASATVSVFRYDASKQSQVKFWVYRIDYGTTEETYTDNCCWRDRNNRCVSCQKTRTVTVRRADPGVPLDVWQTAASTNHRPGINAAGTGCALAGSSCKYVTPKDVIGQNANRVNWGLLPYSTDNQNLGTGKVGIIDVDPRNTNPKLAAIRNAYRLNQRQAYGIEYNSYGPNLTVADGHALGLIAKGSTNTTPSLYSDTWNVQSANKSLKRSRDLYSACPAPYGVILVTDGESNNGNPSNGTWSKCYENAGSYPAGSAHNLYNLFNQNPRVNTWTIGISEDVQACELNFTAYAGRTDANSPRGDAGYSGWAAAMADDPGNPYVAKPNADISSLATFDDQYNTSHGSNAFFPADSEALREAITAIVNATAVGDYTTSAPVSGLTAGTGHMVYLPSTEFPSWRGQFYAFDTRRQQFLDPPTNKVPNPDFEIWNAADKLNARPSSERKIFTWKLASSGKSYDLVEVTTANLATLQTIAGTAALTANVVDYVRGNDGTLTGKARSWKLGPVINSTPAIVASPEKWTQGNVPAHTDLERISRDPLLFVGSNSGMLHAFRAADGEEQIALLPPSLLARQVDLYQNYVDSKKFRPSGQLPDPAQHLYGVANSLRFGDVRIGKDYRTVGLVTLGPGGEEIAAIDITKIPRPDASPYNDPVTVLWSKTDAELAGLGTTWSIPAMAPTMKGTANNDDGKWRLLLGSGFDAASTAETQKDSTNYTPPRAFSLDVATGDLLQTKALATTTGATHGNFVGNQAFADVVLFDPTAPSYKPDNIALMGVQADLNGRLWFLWTPSSSSLYNFSGDPVKGVDTTTLYGVNQSQPFYYNPAASGYGAYNKLAGSTGQEKVGCVAYAFGSGSLYEKSEAVTGPRVGEAGYFIPRVYVATSEKPDVTTAYKLTASPTALTDSQIWQREIAGSWCIGNCDDPDTTKRVYKTLGPATQLTAPPFLLAAKDDTQSVTALFLVYDPEEGCDGNSYVLQVDFKGTGASCDLKNNQGNYDVTQKAFNAGAGAASGFTIAGTQVLVAQSGVGEGQRAKLFVPEGLAASLAGGVEPRVRWWKELK